MAQSQSLDFLFKLACLILFLFSCSSNEFIVSRENIGFFVFRYAISECIRTVYKVNSVDKVNIGLSRVKDV